MKKIKILLFFVPLLILFFISLQLVYIPFVKINSSNISKNVILNLIKSKSCCNITFVSIIKKIDFKKNIQLYGNHKIRKNSFLSCSIDIIQNIEYYSINLNGYNMIIDKYGRFIEEVDESRKINSRFLFNVNVKSNQDTKDIYLTRIAPFLEYVLINSSKLCLMINQINYDDHYGLYFNEFDKKKIIFGKRTDYTNLENDLIMLRNNLKEKNIYDKYNEFDLRFYKRIVLRCV